jgi:hypothetical protein
VIKSTAAEASKALAKQSNPKLSGFVVNVEGGDHTPGKTIFFFPAFNFFSSFVDAGQPVLSANPDL